MARFTSEKLRAVLTTDEVQKVRLPFIFRCDRALKNKL